MAPRSSRDHSEADVQNPAAPYRDEEDSILDESSVLATPDATEAQTDALSFLRIDDEDHDGLLRGRPPWATQLKHSLADGLPPRIRRAWRATAKWIRGPNPPRPWRIKPYFEGVQTLPVRIVDAYFPKRAHKIGLLIAFYVAWLLTFSLVLKRSAFAADVPGYGSPVNIGCLARFWSRHNGCGINGDGCRPFDNTTFTFRCPASCEKASILEPYAVGDRMVNYVPLVIGGPMGGEGQSGAIYRGDSFICSAAIHSGFMSDKKGGCGVIQLVGEKSRFPTSRSHGMKSISFDSYFPMSFSFIKGSLSTCQDLRWPLLAVSVIYSTILSLFTTSPSVFFSSVFTGLFAHVALVSDPPGNSDYRALISTGLGRFLPSAFCMAVIYLVAVRFTLRNLTAQFEKTILWLGACWVGSLNNYTFDKIPIQRLTPHDIQQQPGAIPALITVIMVILSISISQAWFLRVEGLLPKYLFIYGIICGSLLLLLAIPDLKIRLHHYILALCLLPGTRLQMRPSLLYQGLLVGLFINGIARWGFDSILQTPLELRGDAPIGTELPLILPPIVHANVGKHMPPNITFEWVFPDDERAGGRAASNHDYDGISVLVNDVERFKGYRDQNITRWTWRRLRAQMPEYFRFAYMMGGSTGDYTRAGTWDSDGSWREMEAGPSL